MFNVISNFNKLRASTFLLRVHFVIIVELCFGTIEVPLIRNSPIVVSLLLFFHKVQPVVLNLNISFTHTSTISVCLRICTAPSLGTLCTSVVNSNNYISSPVAENYILTQWCIFD